MGTGASAAAAPTEEQKEVIEFAFPVFDLCDVEEKEGDEDCEASATAAPTKEQKEVIEFAFPVFDLDDEEKEGDEDFEADRDDLLSQWWGDEVLMFGEVGTLDGAGEPSDDDADGADGSSAGCLQCIDVEETVGYSSSLLGLPCEEKDPDYTWKDDEGGSGLRDIVDVETVEEAATAFEIGRVAIEATRQEGQQGEVEAVVDMPAVAAGSPLVATLAPGKGWATALEEEFGQEEQKVIARETDDDHKRNMAKKQGVSRPRLHGLLGHNEEQYLEFAGQVAGLLHRKRLVIRAMLAWRKAQQILRKVKIIDEMFGDD